VQAVLFQTVDQRSRYKLEACHTPPWSNPTREGNGEQKKIEGVDGKGVGWKRKRNERRKRRGSKGRRKKDIAEWGRKRKLRSEEEGKLEGV